MMIPLFFGESARPLLGVHTPAAGKPQRQGVVICPPFGREYMNSHRTCRILAAQLSAKGLEALRFDYFGTGNSAGEVADLSLASAVEDTLAAIQEIADLGSVRRVTLIGLRIGALVAAEAAATAPAVNKLVLWDPVADGSAYVADLVEETQQINPNGDRQRGGFVFTGSLLREVEAASLFDRELWPAQVLIAASQDVAEHRELYEHIQARGPSTEFECSSADPSWASLGDAGVGAVPADLLRRIAEW